MIRKKWLIATLQASHLDFSAARNALKVITTATRAKYEKLERAESLDNGSVLGRPPTRLNQA